MRRTKIPIVIGRIDHIDVHGFVKNLARPGGNITGLSFQTGDLTVKCLELLKEIAPGLSHVAVVWDATGNRKQLKAMETASRALAVKSQIIEVRGAPDFDRAFEAAEKAHARGLLILGSPFLTFNAAGLAKLSIKHRLPSIYTNTNFAQSGGLLAYGPNESDPTWGWKRAAVYVDKILKGTKPSELPVEQPTKFDLVIKFKNSQADRINHSSQCFGKSRSSYAMIPGINHGKTYRIESSGGSTSFRTQRP